MLIVVPLNFGSSSNNLTSRSCWLFGLRSHMVSCFKSQVSLWMISLQNLISYHSINHLVMAQHTHPLKLDEHSKSPKMTSHWAISSGDLSHLQRPGFQTAPEVVRSSWPGVFEGCLLESASCSMAIGSSFSFLDFAKRILSGTSTIRQENHVNKNSK